jgi:hypothetical protein
MLVPENVPSPFCPRDLTNRLSVPTDSGTWMPSFRSPFVSDVG